MANVVLNLDRPLAVLRGMLLVRRFEEKVLELWAEGELNGHGPTWSLVASTLYTRTM